jgi:hypothetical protein
LTAGYRFLWHTCLTLNFLARCRELHLRTPSVPLRT